MSEDVKRQHSDKRSWWISPGGEVVDAGYNHSQMVRERPEIFGTDDPTVVLEEKGWASVGSYGQEFIVNAKPFNQRQLDAAQTLYYETRKPWVYLVLRGKSDLVPPQMFLQASSVGELMRVLGRSAGRRASLPKSRNFLRGVDLERLSIPLQEAFNLLGLSAKKDKLSANQVVSVFQANDTFLQDHVNRTATELIQDLNEFFQYGPPKGQMAR